MVDVVADELLDLPHGHVLRGDADGKRPLRLGVAQREQRATVTGLDPPLGQELLHVGRQLEEADRVRDV
jgi:hypothetical protein